MRTFFAIGVALFAGTLAAQMTGREAAVALESSRSRLPAFAALYKEELRVLNGDSQSSRSGDQEKRLTWGDHDSDLMYVFAFGPRASYQQILGDDSPLWKALAQQDLCSEGECRKSISDGTRGSVSKKPPGTVNAAGAGYEFRIGELIAPTIELHSDARVEGDDLVFETKDGHGASRITLARFGDQAVVRRWYEKYDDDETVQEVQDWMEFKGARFPKVVRFELRKDGRPIQTRSYTFQELMPDPASRLVWNGWKEGALVKDHDTNVVYRWHNGNLVVAPDWNDASTNMGLAVRLVILAACTLIGAATALWIVRRIRSVSVSR